MFHNNFIQVIETALQGSYTFMHQLWERIIEKDLSNDELSTLLNYLPQPISNNNSNALYLRGLIYLTSENPDYDSAILYFRKAIELGNAWAMAALGNMYEDGNKKLRKDLSAAINLYERAIALKNTYAMTRRAVLYASNGSYREAISLLNEAIRFGNPQAMFNRATMHWYVKFGFSDFNSAIKLYLDAMRSSICAQIHERSQSDISQIINYHLNKLSLPPQYIYELVIKDFIPDSKLAYFADKQKDVFQYMRTLREQDLYEALQHALDPNHSLGKFFRIPEGFFSRFFGKKVVHVWEEGTTLNLISKLYNDMNVKRSPMSTLPLSTTATTISYLLPTYVDNEKMKTIRAEAQKQGLQTISIPAEEATAVQIPTEYSEQPYNVQYIPSVYTGPLYVQTLPATSAEPAPWEAHPEQFTFIPTYPPPAVTDDAPPSYLFTMQQRQTNLAQPDSTAACRPG